MLAIQLVSQPVSRSAIQPDLWAPEFTFASNIVGILRPEANQNRQRGEKEREDDEEEAIEIEIEIEKERARERERDRDRENQ